MEFLSTMGVTAISLVVLAFQNQGHHATADSNKDIYQRTGQHGLNFIFDNLFIQMLEGEVFYLTPVQSCFALAVGMFPPNSGPNPECLAVDSNDEMRQSNMKRFITPHIPKEIFNYVRRIQS